LKGKTLSIRRKVLLYFTVFSALLIALLWLFQVVFLDSFYKMIKTQNIKACAESVVGNLESDGLDDLVEEVARKNDVCILVVTAGLQRVASADASPDCLIHRLDALNLLKLYTLTRDSGGTLLQTYSRVNEGTFTTNPDKYQYAGGPFLPDERAKTQSMVYTRLVTRPDGSAALVLLNSAITPVNSTVETLRIQLVIITAVLLLLSAVLAVLLSRRISRPIVGLNESAKELAQGNYNVRFKGEGYREAEELGGTLNHTAVELSKVEGLRRELLANISHDLRTPLTMIAGYSEMMRDIPGENTPENLQVVIDEANRLGDLVTDLLDLSKLQAGAQTLSPAEMNLTSCIRGILTRYHKLVEQDGYRIAFTHKGEAIVRADEVKISQVVYNLINNAVNYAGEDKAVEVRQKVRDGWVRVEVTDHGAGIAPEQLPLVWDRYYKVDKAHKRAVVGNGLGLSIAKTVLELHGARYGVQSTPGAGSTFWFALELLRSEDAALPGSIETGVDG
jgi:signal transduction histidine kinase